MKDVLIGICASLGYIDIHAGQYHVPWWKWPNAIWFNVIFAKPLLNVNIAEVNFEYICCL